MPHEVTTEQRQCDFAAKVAIFSYLATTLIGDEIALLILWRN